MVLSGWLHIEVNNYLPLISVYQSFFRHVVDIIECLHEHVLSGVLYKIVMSYFV